MARFPERSPDRGPVLAIALSLVLHVAIALAVLLLRLPAAGSAPPERDAMEVALVSLPPDEPTFFTEQPADRADQADEPPDFLSNVDARARDRTANDGTGLPRLDGASEAPHLAMTEGQPEPEPAPPADEGDPPPPEPSAEDVAPGDLSVNEPVAESLREQLASRAVNLSPRPAGDSDFSQEAMQNPSGSASLPGEITLSTTAWDYAPWLQAFRRQVAKRWHPPMAYRMGMIDGWVRVRLEIARSGDLLGVQVLDEEVDHASLSEAVVYALEAAARYRELPAHFPDESLTLQIKFIYPAVRTR